MSIILGSPSLTMIFFFFITEWMLHFRSKAPLSSSLHPGMYVMFILHFFALMYSNAANLIVLPEISTYQKKTFNMAKHPGCNFISSLDISPQSRAVAVSLLLR
jgi:hypothetical protein